MNTKDIRERPKRVTRSLGKAQIDALREGLVTMVPETRAGIGTLIRTMRHASRCSQREYAKLCDVSPRVLMAIEAGSTNVHVETLEKLLRPFGYQVGVVRTAE
ncbi:MAG TPA: helix-turn-helix transcriptional regulator [Steroidobacteraceae bacterium]|nr:helix-turn-helix transcriptional regulator [Steroidobacteraceae bacterium]